ncbi:MAG: hypothetical protein K6C32_05190 [Bacilli bacterium]|nr:hypothetical protein [Bacilli bacterium]
MKAKIAETPYRCAFGYASNLNNQGVENVLKEADALMYKDKAESKKQKTK